MWIVTVWTRTRDEIESYDIWESLAFTNLADAKKFACVTENHRKATIRFEEIYK